MYYVNESFLQSITVNLCVLFSPLKSRRKGIIPIRHAIGLKAPGEKRYKYILWNLFSAANGTRKINTVHADNRKKCRSEKYPSTFFKATIWRSLSTWRRTGEVASIFIPTFLIKLFFIILQQAIELDYLNLKIWWQNLTKSKILSINSTMICCVALLRFWGIWHGCSLWSAEALRNNFKQFEKLTRCLNKEIHNKKD